MTKVIGLLWGNGPFEVHLARMKWIFRSPLCHRNLQS